MSMSTFLALCLLALPPSDCPGGCHPQHHLPLLGRYVLPSLDGEFDWSGDYGDLTAGDGFVVSELPEPAAPVVLLRSLEVGAADQQSFLASSDQPAYWTVVPFGPLSVEVQMPLAEFEPATVEYVVLLLDGKPVENNRFLMGTPPASFPSPDGQLRMAHVFNFPCPAPGKHLVQARYKLAGLWSRISEPLYFDVRLPDPPRIVAISDVGGIPAPVRRAGLISITKPEVIVRLANVSQNASVVAYLDGKPISTAIAQESCCRTIRLQGHITPGIHSLRLRTVTSGGSCSVTSEPSDEVVFHYYDEDVYLLRPGSRCKTYPTTAGMPARGGNVANSRASLAALTSPVPNRSLGMFDLNQPSVRLAVLATDGREDAFRPPVCGKDQSRPSSNIRLATFTEGNPAEEELKAREESQGLPIKPAPAQNQTSENPVAAEKAPEAVAPQPVVPHANDNNSRTQAGQEPIPLFYFASTAYFPLRQFGLQGEALDREGALIYEDMAFSFDREGNYSVRFTIGTPAVPTTIQLRFLIQPCLGGPWYTVTLQPIEFPPNKVADGKYTPSMFRNHVVRGTSEILRRCYGEMGQNATIRREGTARFGFGLAGLSQNNAN